MDLKLQSEKKSQEVVEETLPVPCTKFIKESVNGLKAKHGKHAVNKKIREMLLHFIEQNQAS